MRRILALDMGTVRIGVAVSDPLGMFATGIAVLSAEGEWEKELDGLMAAHTLRPPHRRSRADHGARRGRRPCG
ncbi:hypothetical protein MASR2M17_01430 [Aminivibrio sp.]